jgi:hypothetical protein
MPMVWFIDRAKYLIIPAMVVVTVLLGAELKHAVTWAQHPLMALMMMLPMAVGLAAVLRWFNEHRANERTPLMWHMQGGFVLAGLLWWLMLGLSWWMLFVPVPMLGLFMWDNHIAELRDDELEAEQ